MMAEKITKIDDETLEIEIVTATKRRITKTELLSQKETAEYYLAEFDK